MSDNINILLIGDTQVGKTSFIASLYAKINNFNVARTLEIGNDSSPISRVARKYPIHHEGHNLNFIDTRGLGRSEIEYNERTRLFLQLALEGLKEEVEFSWIDWTEELADPTNKVDQVIFVISADALNRTDYWFFDNVITKESKGSFYYKLAKQCYSVVSPKLFPIAIITKLDITGNKLKEEAVIDYLCRCGFPMNNIYRIDNYTLNELKEDTRSSQKNAKLNKVCDFILDRHKFYG